jgi:hypothetical protein
MTERLAATYVTHEGREYLVSTINRQSSALGDFASYAETMVWPVNEHRERTQQGCVAQGECTAGSLKTHFAFVEQIARNGMTKEPTDAH